MAIGTDHFKAQLKRHNEKHAKLHHRLWRFGLLTATYILRSGLGLVIFGECSFAKRGSFVSTKYALPSTWFGHFVAISHREPVSNGDRVDIHVIL